MPPAPNSTPASTDARSHTPSRPEPFAGIGDPYAAIDVDTLSDAARLRLALKILTELRPRFNQVLWRPEQRHVHLAIRALALVSGRRS